MIPIGQLDLIAHDATHMAVNTGRLSMTGRESVILRWTVEGVTYEGEASPLEGYGQDHFAKCREELSCLDAPTLAQTVETALSASDLIGAVEHATESLESPAARFALETCLFSRLSDLRQQPIWELLRASWEPNSPAPETLPTSLVIDPSAADWLARTSHAFDKGVRTFKVKVGRELSAELRVLHTLASRWGPELRIRIDPNQTWSLSEVSEFTRQCADLPIEWLEDPSEEADGWRELGTPTPLAADEILIGEEPSPAFLERLGASFVVLKPMSLGGYTACLAWARVARQLGAQISVSHLFDGPLALDATIHLAFAVQSPGITPGLGLHRGLDGWTQKPRWAEIDHLKRPLLKP